MLSRVLAIGAVALLASACTSLPEPESQAAQTYVRRCGECHRAYTPGSMTWPMWEYQLRRMRLLYTQLRRPWLSSEEETLVTDYLKRHAGGRS